MFYEPIKRLMDIVISFVGIIVLFPLWVFIPILIKLDSSGPVFVESSSRVGKKKILFFMYKFRTMFPNAREITRKDPRFKRLYEEYKRSSYKLFNDPRVTRVGKFLRRFSLDELPQLFNVFKGEMSIVGPRAYYPDELDDQQKKYPHTKELVKEVLGVKPGITGMWQVSGRSQINFDKRIKMDAEYARRKSIVYDILIMLKTPWAMISGKGAV